MASASGISYGAITNGDFTGGSTLPGWTTSGDVAAVASLFGVAPPAGATRVAGATTINLGVPPANTLSGTPATIPGTVDTTLGLASGTINSTAQGAVQEASGFAQSFAATAGDTISFRWNFITGEDSGPFGKDFGFYTFHQGTSSSSLNILATSSSPSVVVGAGPGGSLGLANATGYQTTTVTVPSTGTWTLGFGVGDALNNPGTDSVLGVASVTYTPVPEPWAWSLMSALALGGLAVARRTRFSRA